MVMCRFVLRYCLLQLRKGLLIVVLLEDRKVWDQIRAAGKRGQQQAGTRMDSSNYACGVNRSSRMNTTLYSLPVHCLNEDDLRNENARGIMGRFHAPENEHNRFLASLTQEERAILRTIERPQPYKTTRPGWNTDVWPTTAPGQQSHGMLLASSSRPSSSSSRVAADGKRQHSKQHQGHQASANTQQLGTTTQKGVPCYGVSMLIDVDLMTGQPASAHICETQPWRVARVKSYPVPHSSYGHGEGGKRAQHQSYGFYKYYGFAGQGAKTSWASSSSKFHAKPAQERS